MTIVEYNAIVQEINTGFSNKSVERYCFYAAKLWSYVNSNCLEINSENALQWLEVFSKGKSADHISRAKTFIHRLFRLLEPETDIKKMIYGKPSQPPRWATTIYKDYLKSLSGKNDLYVSSATLNFLDYLTDCGISGFDQIRPRHIYEYRTHLSVNRSHVLRINSSFINYLIKRGSIPEVMSMSLDCAQMRIAITEDRAAEICRLSSNDGYTGPELFSRSDDICKATTQLLEFGIILNCTIIKRFIKLLSVFLFDHDCKFSLQLAYAWIENYREHADYYNKALPYYKAAAIIDSVCKGSADIASNFALIEEQRTASKFYSRFPNWMKKVARNYIKSRITHGLDKESTSKHRCIIYGLAEYLTSKSCNSFNEITPDLLADYRDQILSRSLTYYEFSIRSFILYCCAIQLLNIKCYYALFDPKYVKTRIITNIPSWLPDEQAIEEYYHRIINRTLYYQSIEDSLTPEVRGAVLSVLNRINKSKAYKFYRELILNFFRCAELHDIKISDITPGFVSFYFAHNKSRLNNSVLSKVMTELATRGQVDPVLPYAFKHRIAAGLKIIPKQLSLEIPSDSGSLNHSDVMKHLPTVISELKRLGYSSTVQNNCRYALIKLAVFMFEYGLKFTYQLGYAYLRAEQQLNKRPFINASQRLGYFLLERISENKPVTMQSLIEYYSKHAEQEKKVYPEVFQKYISSFLTRRETEGKKSSTLCMDRSSISDFTEFLIARGCSSYSELNTELIHEYNITNWHATYEGKKAYSVRTKRFLYYLAEEHVVPFFYVLLISTGRTPAPSRPVSVLNEAQENFITRYLYLGRTDFLYLRNSLALLLAYEYALRFSDLVDLKYSNFNFSSMTLTKHQVKTGILVSLPLTVPIVNRLVKYRKAVNDFAVCEYVFISSYAPYKPLTRGSLFMGVLSDLIASGCSPFTAHDLRRTKASRMLADEVEPDLISMLLGHSGTDQLRPYLNTDTEMMKKCVMPFNGFEYKAEVRHEQ